MPRLIPYLLALTLATAAQAASVDRVIKKFDFEERAIGNFEDVPMEWVKIQGPGLPHYVNGGLTTDQAYTGRYSFGFRLNGGSLIYRYPAGKIAVRPGATYCVEAMAKTQSLDHARVRMTAYFADEAGTPIRSTVVRSEPINPTDWTPIAVEAAAPPSAASLVIELGLVQGGHLRAAAATSEPAIEEQDIDGQAWFDEVAVSQVPQIRLETAAAGNAFRRSESPVLLVAVNDRLTEDLVGRLDVRDIDGKIAYQRSGNIGLRRDGPASTARVNLPSLPTGWYRATITFEGNGKEVGRQSVAFVQLPDDSPELQTDARLGVIATNLPADQWPALPKVVPLIGASRVKLPVWSPGVSAHAFEAIVEKLKQSNLSTTACMLNPPAVAGAKRLPWGKLLTLKNEDWQPELSATVSRMVERVDRWQFGNDVDATDLAVDAASQRAFAAVKMPMATLLGKNSLAMPWPVYADLTAAAPTAPALFVPTDVLPPHLPLYLNDAKTAEASLTLQFLTTDQYGRPAQVRDLAQRLGYALSTGVRRVDVPLPFDPKTLEPIDTFLPLRTLLRTLGGADYKGKLPLGDDIEALLFDRDGEGVVLAWTKSPQAKPKTVPVVLGNAPRTVDLNGNVSAVLKPKSADGTTDLVIGPTPVLIIGTDGMLARLRTGFSFDNPLLESSYKPHIRKLRFTNPYTSEINGKLKLGGPAGWNVTLQQPTFKLAANAAYEGVVTLAVPFSAVAGVKSLELEVQLDSGQTIKLPMSMRLGLSDLGLETSGFRDGPDVVVQQMITNYGTKKADYIAFASMAGSARQERTVQAIAPGATVIKRYRFVNVSSAANDVVRSGVRETQGTRQLTDEISLK